MIVLLLALEASKSSFDNELFELLRSELIFIREIFLILLVEVLNKSSSDVIDFSGESIFSFKLTSNCFPLSSFCVFKFVYL